jgi:hypothetical protein
MNSARYSDADNLERCTGTGLDLKRSRPFSFSDRVRREHRLDIHDQNPHAAADL